ncbi:hypothetical protein ES703_79947 [subsurface metagenome]
MSNKEATNSPDFQSNNSLPVLHIDNAYISIRNDKMAFVNFVSQLPDNDLEQARIMISEDDLHNVIDSMCSALNYYPKKPKVERSSPKNKK